LRELSLPDVSQDTLYVGLDVPVKRRPLERLDGFEAREFLQKWVERSLVDCKWIHENGVYREGASMALSVNIPPNSGGEFEVFVNSLAQPRDIGSSHLSYLDGLDAQVPNGGGVVGPVSFLAGQTGQVRRHVIGEQGTARERINVALDFAVWNGSEARLLQQVSEFMRNCEVTHAGSCPRIQADKHIPGIRVSVDIGVHHQPYS